MFSLREFVKKGLLSAIGVQSDYWVILNAANCFSKGVLLDEDLIEINAKIDEKNTPIEPVEESIVEEATQEETQETTQNEASVEETIDEEIEN